MELVNVKLIKILILSSLLFIFFTIGPVSAGRVINQGDTVYIGESGLNVTHALNEAQGSPIDGVPPLKIIGWWASPAHIYITIPDVSLDLDGRYQNLLITQAEFTGYEGAWYVVDINQDHHAMGNPVFIVATAPVPTPEFPSVFLPATMIIGFLGAVLLIQRIRKH